MSQEPIELYPPPPPSENGGGGGGGGDCLIDLRFLLIERYQKICGKNIRQVSRHTN